MSVPIRNVLALLLLALPCCASTETPSFRDRALDALEATLDPDEECRIQDDDTGYCPVAGLGVVFDESTNLAQVYWSTGREPQPVYGFVTCPTDTGAECLVHRVVNPH